MKKVLILLLLSHFSILQYGQIIADHNVVDKFDDIPQYYIDQVKKMWLSVPGRSHAEGYRVGLETLENINPRYAVNVTLSGTPESYTTSYLRMNSAHWGDYDTPTGWSHDYYYFWDWYDFPEGVAQTKVGISYAHNHSLTMAAYGFAWCYDEGTTDATGYINATQSYVDYCTSNSIPTKVFFTTGPLDGFIGEGEYGYMNYLRYEQIRDYVSANPSAIFFDYADIISYNNEGVQSTTTWDGHTFPAIAPDLIGEDGAGGHISGMATIRLAKAMWWMLARIAGWDGGTTTIPVTGITVTGASGATAITTDNGTLQLTATILPADATNKTVTWSVVNGTGQATISSTGLVTAVSNGTVTARATANDGSGVVGSLVNHDQRPGYTCDGYYGHGSRRSHNDYYG